MSVLNIGIEISEFSPRFPWFIDGVKAMDFSLHYRIKYFKNNNCFSSTLNLFFFSVNKLNPERFPEKCSTVHSNARHYKFECLFRSRVSWIDCNQVIRTIRRKQMNQKTAKA